MRRDIIPNNHKSVVRNQGYTRAAVSHVEKHNERKNENYSNLEVVLEQSHNNINFKSCDGTYLGTFDKMIQDGEISTRGLKLNDKGIKPESSIVAEMIFDVNTEFFEEQYTSHGYNSGYDFATAFYAEAYKMAVAEVGDEKYILSAVMHADERHKGLSEQLGREIFHYHLHVTYIPVVQTEIKWTKRAKPELVGKVKEIINQVSHSKKWESEKVVGEDGKEHLVYSYSKLQDRYHDHMKAAGFHGFERGERGSTTEHLSVLDYKAKVRQEELAEKENMLKLASMELDDVQTDLENTRIKNNDIKAEQDGLQSERDKLENQVAQIRELQKLKTKTQKIKIPDKPMLGSNAKMPYDDLVKLKEMADTYIANETEIKDIRKRRVAVARSETDATAKEKDLAGREKSMKAKEDLLASASEVKTDRDRLQRLADNRNTKIAELTTENNSLSAKLKQAFDAIAHIVKAARLLKYAGEELSDYKIENLTPKQATLLDALAHFSARLADKNNFANHAEQMRKFINLDEGIKGEMKILNPQIFPEERTQQKAKSSRGWER